MTTHNPVRGLLGSVTEIASTNIVTVDRGMSLQDAAAHIANNDIGFVVVDEGGSVAGVISERDIVLAIAEGAELDEIHVEDIMSTDLVTVAETDDLATAARVMLDNGVRHLLITGQDFSVISIRDVLAAAIE